MEQKKDTSLPRIVMVGRPNVGKSTLFNRLTRSRRALVAPVPGTTRDRRENDVYRGIYRFRLVDTGGLALDATAVFSREIEEQVEAAVRDAVVIWLMVDGREGINPFDQDLQRWIMRRGKPWLVIVNKMDAPAERGALAEFYTLGSENILAVSGLHGSGVDALLESSARLVPGLKGDAHPDGDETTGESDRAAGADQAIKVAFLGRPNVGKSSLVNRILGQSRMIVSSAAGTTREAVDTPFRAFDQDFVLVDTAGIRRRARTKEHVEKIGVLQSLGALNRVEVAVLVVDATEDVAVQDAHIARYIQEHRRGVVIALNKWDRVRGQKARAREIEEAVRERLRFLEYAVLVRTNAVDGEGIDRLFKEIVRATQQFRRQIQTADLNRVVQAVALRTAPPAVGRSRTRVYYGVQTGRCPPAFSFYTNHPTAIDAAYTRYFENQLRYHFGLKGTPIRIHWRDKRGAEEGVPPKTRDAGTQGAGQRQRRRRG